MKTLKFYGYSDDNFAYEIDGKPVDEFGCYDRPCVVRVGTLNEGLLVVGHYAPGKVASWSVGVSQLDEDAPLPLWARSIKFQAEGYSVQMTLEVPDDATIEEVKR